MKSLIFTSAVSPDLFSKSFIILESGEKTLTAVSSSTLSKAAVVGWLRSEATKISPNIVTRIRHWYANSLRNFRRIPP